MGKPSLMTAVLGAALLSACASMDYPPPPGPPEALGASVDVSYFYDQLSPYGEWVEEPSYGWVWTPRAVSVEWRPYTLGHWAYTDDEGWLWVSDEEWGWAAYHYGRWYWGASRWYWVPGRDWAPAWVSWRTGGGYIGWAPLPPQASFAAEVGLGIAAAALDAILQPRAYCFVEERHFTDERIVSRVVPLRQNVTIVSSTTNITNYNVVQSRVVNRSLSVANVERAVGHAVPRARAVTAPTVAGPHRAQVQGDEVKVFRPPIQAAPAERKPVTALARTSTPAANPAQAEQQRMVQRHAQERASLESRHSQQLQSPPKGVSMDQLKARHENEHQALQQRQQREAQRAVSRQESQAQKSQGSKKR